MATVLLRYLRKAVYMIEYPGIRHKRIQRGLDYLEAKSLAQKMQQWNATDPTIDFKVNIGYTADIPKRQDYLSRRLTLRQEQRRNFELEKAAKNRTIQVPLEDVRNEWFSTGAASTHIRRAAEYYGVYNSLFGDAYFHPIIPLDVHFPCVDDATSVTPVYFGNVIKPSEAASEPSVTFPAKPDEHYTLIMTTPDCHFESENTEYLHWFVGNIPGSDLEKGQVLCNYMQPFPPRGIGWCRYIFVLFRQEKDLDFGEYQRKTPCNSLAARTFSTAEFYRRFENDITPISLAFFQSDWDECLTNFFHNVLEMREPVFEYDFEVPGKKKQVWYPEAEAFNLYLETYKDPKQLQKELLVEKLKERHPFQMPKKPLKYPDIFHMPKTVPTWKKDEIHLKNHREGKYRFFDEFNI